jgi:hypothetical protein
MVEAFRHVRIGLDPTAFDGSAKLAVSRPHPRFSHRRRTRQNEDTRGFPSMIPGSGSPK